MPATASDDGVVLGLKFDISRVKQTLDQVKNMVQGMAEDSAKAVAKTDDALEKARKNAEKWKIEPTTNGIEAAQKELDILNATIVNQQNELSNCEREHERLADKYGETSSQALKLEKRMLNLQASIEKNTKKNPMISVRLWRTHRTLWTLHPVPLKTLRKTPKARARAWRTAARAQRHSM